MLVVHRQASGTITKNAASTNTAARARTPASVEGDLFSRDMSEPFSSPLEAYAFETDSKSNNRAWDSKVNVQGGYHFHMRGMRVQIHQDNLIQVVVFCQNLSEVAGQGVMTAADVAQRSEEHTSELQSRH